MNIICIDPGHGGDDGGVRAPDGTPERDLMLALGKQLGNACREQRWQVTMTRIDGGHVPIQQRASRANRAPSTCFVSLHACAIVVSASSTQDEASTGGIRVVYQGGRGTGLTLATAVHDALVAYSGHPDGGVLAAPRLDLLRWCSIPAILVELGDLADQRVATLLETPQKQRALAEVLAGAVTGVFG